MNELTTPTHPGTGLLGTVFNLIEAEVGGGILSLPYAFAAGGVAASSLIMVALFVVLSRGVLLIVSMQDVVARQVLIWRRALHVCCVGGGGLGRKEP